MRSDQHHANTLPTNHTMGAISPTAANSSKSLRQAANLARHETGKARRTCERGEQRGRRELVQRRQRKLRAHQKTWISKIIRQVDEAATATATTNTIQQQLVCASGSMGLGAAAQARAPQNAKPQQNDCENDQQTASMGPSHKTHLVGDVGAQRVARRHQQLHVPAVQASTQQE